MSWSSGRPYSSCLHLAGSAWAVACSPSSSPVHLETATFHPKGKQQKPSSEADLCNIPSRSRLTRDYLDSGLRGAPYFVGAGGAAGATGTVADAAAAAAVRAGRSNTRVVNRPNTSPQKAAPIPNTGTSATVTRKHTSAPSVEWSRNDATNAVCSTRNMARPASVAMKAGGVASMSRVKNGENRPTPMPRMPTMTAAVYCLCFSPVAEISALTGPAMQVHTQPTTPATMAPMPDAAVV